MTPDLKTGIRICTAATLAPLLSGCTGGGKPRPNILFILSDDHTSQSWGIYGGHLAPYAPNEHIAQLAREGCMLDNAFCTNSISAPSRAAILTGQYSHHNGVYTLGDALAPARDNIAKHLQQAGYATAVIGKWHLKKQPSGFAPFVGVLRSGDRSARKPQPVRQSSLCRDYRPHEGRTARTAHALQRHRPRVGGHAADHRRRLLVITKLPGAMPRAVGYYASS